MANVGCFFTIGNQETEEVQTNKTPNPTKGFRNLLLHLVRNRHSTFRKERKCFYAFGRGSDEYERIRSRIPQVENQSFDSITPLTILLLIGSSNPTISPIVPAIIGQTIPKLADIGSAVAKVNGPHAVTNSLFPFA